MLGDEVSIRRVQVVSLFAEEDIPLQLESQQSPEKPIHKLANHDEKVRACQILNADLCVDLWSFANVPVQEQNQNAEEGRLGHLSDESLGLPSDEDQSASSEQAELLAERHMSALSSLQVEFAIL